MTNSIFDNIFKITSLKYLKKLSGFNVFLPFYHAISDEKVKHIGNLYAVRNTSIFEQDLEYLLQNFKPIDYHALIKHKENNESINKPSFHLTFDDGLSQVYDIIAPILLRKGIPATFFLNTSFIDNKNLFYRYKIGLIIDKLNKKSISKATINEICSNLNLKESKINSLIKELLLLNYKNTSQINHICDFLEIDVKEYLSSVRPYLSTEQIKSIQKQGFSIGSHSIDHPDFRELTMNEQISQIRESMKEIVSKFKLDYRLFSFPFTDDTLPKKLFNTINEQITDITFGTAGVKFDNRPGNLQRFPMDRDLRPANTLINKEFIAFLAKKAINKHIIDC